MNFEVWVDAVRLFWLMKVVSSLKKSKSQLMRKSTERKQEIKHKKWHSDMQRKCVESTKNMTKSFL